MTGDALRSAAAHLDVETADFDADAALVVEPADQRHLVKALRLRTGASVTITDRRGRWRPMRLVAEGGSVVLEPGGEVTVEPLLPPFAVAAAMPKGDRLEWMVQKLTELGVTRLVLLHADRSVVRWTGDKVVRGRARLERVITAACRQSRRVYWPELVGPVGARDVLATAVVAEPDGAPFVIPHGSAPAARDEMPTIAIGPEGGWSADELALAATTVRLGAHVLRTETAAVAAASLLGVMSPFPSVRRQSLE